MYDRLMVPTDGSDGMGRVVDHAARLARVHDADLHAVYVVDTASRASLPMGGSLEGAHGLLHREGEAALDAVERRAGEDVAVERTVAEGSPGREIVDQASDGDCDMIVMGTHGRGGIDRLLLGSVAERVLRQSPVPVLTIRMTALD